MLSSIATISRRATQSRAEGEETYLCIKPEPIHLTPSLHRPLQQILLRHASRIPLDTRPNIRMTSYESIPCAVPQFSRSTWWDIPVRPCGNEWLRDGCWTDRGEWREVELCGSEGGIEFVQEEGSHWACAEGTFTGLIGPDVYTFKLMVPIGR